MPKVLGKSSKTPGSETVVLRAAEIAVWVSAVYGHFIQLTTFTFWSTLSA
ncbi:MAG: hypothetical protein ICV78_24605 [Tolypothrix sp. Co-bin9]|nr:hypothetical protein [Tolypothrix sp. Co-bin9]